MSKAASRERSAERERGIPTRREKGEKAARGGEKEMKVDHGGVGGHTGRREKEKGEKERIGEREIARGTHTEKGTISRDWAGRLNP